MGKICSKSNGTAILDTVALDVTQNNIKFERMVKQSNLKGFMTLYVEAKDDKDNEKKINYLT